MKKRKKWPFVAGGLALLLVLCYCYLFLGSRITDAGSEKIARKTADGRDSQDADKGRQDVFGLVTPGTQEYRGFVLDNVLHSPEEIDALLVLDIKEHEYFRERNMANEHGGGGLFAYDEEIMGWLFSK